MAQTFSDHDPLDIAKTFARFSPSTCRGQRQPALRMASVGLALEHPGACRLALTGFGNASPPDDSSVPEASIAVDGDAFLQHTLAERVEEQLLRPELDGMQQLVRFCLSNVHGVACLCFLREVDRHWIDCVPTGNNTERSLAIFERGIGRDGEPRTASKQ